MKKNFLLMLLASFSLFALYASLELLLPVQRDNESMEIMVPKGATFRQASDILRKNRLIRDRRIFLLIGRLTGVDRRIRAGYYSLWSGMTPIDILKILRSGKIIEYEVKVLEGDSIYEISQAFANKGIISAEKFLKLVSDPEFLASHRIEAPSAEGYIFPDTYLVPKGMAPEEALDIMIAKMRAKFDEKLSARMQELGMNENQVLTLASIIEKEAVIDSERNTISAVYHNRLRKNMILQADPTAIYGIKSSKEKITLNDLRRKTPYNTYVIKGLPPGPIASPGLRSIEAALHPDNVPYIYFVAQDDRSHRFAVTEKEHAGNVRLYRQRKQEMKESVREDKNGNDPS